MSISSFIWLILTFVVNFIMDFSFWTIMFALFGGFLDPSWQPEAGREVERIAELSILSIFIPAVLSETRAMQRGFMASTGSHKAGGDVYTLLYAALSEVCRRAHLDPEEFKLYFYKRPYREYNAFSLGSRSLSFSLDLLNDFSFDEICGIMAHEVGHIENGHTRFLLFRTGMEWFGQVIVFVYNTLIFVCNLFVWIPFVGLLITLFVLFIRIQYGILSFVLHIPMWFMNNFGSRQNEYDADAYAAKIGLGNELIAGLSHIDAAYGSHRLSFFERLASDHPDTRDRIEHIREEMEMQ